MRLTAGGVREMHWHKEGEWAYMLKGRARITAVDQNLCAFQADVGEGEGWFFPAGIPHSIQGLEGDGCEFLLVFDDGDFDENSTFAYRLVGLYPEKRSSPKTSMSTLAPSIGFLQRNFTFSNRRSLLR